MFKASLSAYCWAFGEMAIILHTESLSRSILNRFSVTSVCELRLCSAFSETRTAKLWPPKALLSDVWGEEVHKAPLWAKEAHRELSCIAAFSPHCLTDGTWSGASLLRKWLTVASALIWRCPGRTNSMWPEANYSWGFGLKIKRNENICYQILHPSRSRKISTQEWKQSLFFFKVLLFD